MLRRLIGKEDVSSFSNLVQYLEPVQGYRRNRADNFTRFSPYSLMVDIAAPDQKAVRDAAVLLSDKTLLTDTIRLKQVELLFQQWQHDARRVQLDAEQIPALHDFISHASSLEELATVGLAAIQQYKSNNFSTRFWNAQREGKLKAAQKEFGYCELKIVEPLKQFVQLLGLN